MLAALNGTMAKTSLPDVPWRGPILSRKHVVYVFGPPVHQARHLLPPYPAALLPCCPATLTGGPPVHQTNLLCRKLAENFDGQYVTASSLMDREVKSKTALGHVTAM